MKDIKRRKNSIDNIMKITKAMELVAFSKLRKVKQRVTQTEPFFNKIYETMRQISKFSPQISSVYFNPKNVKKRCYLVIAGDKGLAGNYNANIFRYAQEQMRESDERDIFIISVGKRATNYFDKKNYNIYLQYNDISEDIDINLAFEISKKVVDGFLKNEFQEFYIVYTNFVSVLVQKPDIKKILPIDFNLSDEGLDNKNSERFKNGYMIYDPSPEVVFEKIIPQYIAGVLYGAVIESFASEQGARRMAMDAASKNAKDMTKEIDVVINKARQANITQEITEISTGANAI